MVTTSTRLLQLLTRLQTGRRWQIGELADRLEVSERTVRRDVERLRHLGYDIAASRDGSGYELIGRVDMPPVQLDDNDVTALVLALRVPTSLVGVVPDEQVDITLAKVLGALPPPQRRRAEALRDHTTSRTPTASGGAADLVPTLSAACRDRTSLRFEYHDHHGHRSTRTVEPLHIVFFDRHWYLVAWDLGRDEWRTLRLDRIHEPVRAVGTFPGRTPPAEDLGAYLAEQVARTLWRVRSSVTVHATATTLAGVRNFPASWFIEPLDEHRCRVLAGAPTYEDLAQYLGALGVPFHVKEDDDDLRVAVAELAERYTAATRDRIVLQLRLIVEAEDYDEAVAFYRDVLGLPEQLAFEDEGEARVAILDAGRATMEIANPAQKRMIDEVEVGHHTSARLRVAFEVADSQATTERLVAAGATLVAPPTETPWRSLNARLDAPAGLHVTVFQELETVDERRARTGFGTDADRGGRG